MSLKKLPKQGIKSWSEDDRPREKFLSKGRESLSDAELIAILLGSGSKNESAVDLSKRILKDAAYNLVQLSQFDIKKLTTYKGMGVAKAVSIAAALELGRRRRQAEISHKKKITSSRDVFEYFQSELSDKIYEEFWLVNLSTANKIINKVFISEGGLGQTIVDQRKIFKAALENNAVSIIIAHNHPSGNIQPSQKDIELTKKIKASASILNINLLDHVIIGEESYFSFADNNYL